MQSQQITQNIIFKKGEKFLINIHLYNPTAYEILSFTLNGRKYQSYEFKEGSTSDKLIIEVEAGMNPGLKEYTIDAIKYIDATEIKDVRMEGDKTIKAGVKYDITPNATIEKEEIDTKAFKLIIDIKDENNLINNNGLYFFLFSDENIVYNTKLKVGMNEITYDNLQMGVDYEYVIVGVYDDYSGNGNSSVVLEHNEFKAQDGFIINKVIEYKDKVEV